MTVKKYPFSYEKHGHDIDLMRVVAMNRIYDMDYDITESDEDEYERLWAIKETCEEILDYCRGPVSWLPGSLYGKARELTILAAEYRANARSTRE